MRCEYGGELYAIYAPNEEMKDGSEWFGEGHFPLQASRMVFRSGKEFKPHKHVLNPRLIKRTQEAFIVISGRMAVEIFNEKKEFIASFEAKAGDLILLYKGYHAVKILEDCVAYEIKAGQYDGYLSEEKEWLNVWKEMTS